MVTLFWYPSRLAQPQMGLGTEKAIFPQTHNPTNPQSWPGSWLLLQNISDPKGHPGLPCGHWVGDKGAARPQVKQPHMNLSPCLGWHHGIPVGLSLPGTCSQSVPTGISSEIPVRTCTFHLLSRAHSIWSLGLEWTLTKVTPAGWKQEGAVLREGRGCEEQQSRRGGKTVGSSALRLTGSPTAKKGGDQAVLTVSHGQDCGTPHQTNHTASAGDRKAEVVRTRA